MRVDAELAPMERVLADAPPATAGIVPGRLVLIFEIAWKQWDPCRGTWLCLCSGVTRSTQAA